MSVIQIPNLGAAISLAGNELFEIVQNGVSVYATIQQVAAFANGQASVTQKQLRGWLAANGIPPYIYAVDAACPADIANAVNIRWLHGNTMAMNDPLYGFIETTLSFSSAQMLAAYIAMGTYPA